MYEKRQLYYGRDTYGGGRGDWRSYNDSYENGRPRPAWAECDHCGSNAEYVNNLGDLVCGNKSCTTNRHKNDDGSRNHGEARKVDRSRYLLIG